LIWNSLDDTMEQEIRIKSGIIRLQPEILSKYVVIGNFHTVCTAYVRSMYEVFKRYGSVIPDKMTACSVELPPSTSLRMTLYFHTNDQNVVHLF
jgi:hypothetical protein